MTAFSNVVSMFKEITKKEQGMSYIIVAEVDTEAEENYHGDKTKVDARILSEYDSYIKFDIKGEHDKKPELTMKLCKTLIDAGYMSFDIRHSY